MSYNYAYSGNAGAPFGRVAPDYIIRKSGTNYLAEPRFDHIPLRDTSLSDLWIAINSDLGRGPVVEFSQGTFTADDTLEVFYEQTTILGQGPGASIISLDDGVDDDLIRNSASGYYKNTWISDVTLDGNRDNNAAGKGIEWSVAAATGGTSLYYAWLTLKNINITECDEDGLYVKSTSGVLTSVVMDSFRIWNNDGHSSGGHQMYFERVFDSFIGGASKNAVSGMRMNNVTTSHFNNIYVGGGIADIVWLDGGDSSYTACGNIFTNCRFDNPTGASLRMDDYAQRNVFSGCSFTNFSQSGTTNTYPCIYVDGNALYNNFYGCFMGHNGIKTDDRWTYAYYENIDAYSKLIGCTSGYGAVLAGNAEHFTTDEYRLAGGSHTIISECYKDSGSAWNA